SGVSYPNCVVSKNHFVLWIRIHPRGGYLAIVISSRVSRRRLGFIISVIFSNMCVLDAGIQMIFSGIAVIRDT
ncbi:hypothetical protein ACHAXS_005795, partial [Conticribra weissflogii]